MDTSNIPARCAEADDPYPDVNAVLYDFPANVQAVLGEHFRGMYLSGPLALGDFSPDSSDIDFVVVTDADLLDDILPSLRAIHAHFNASGVNATRNRLIHTFDDEGADVAQGCGEWRDNWLVERPKAGLQGLRASSNVCGRRSHCR